MKLSIITINYNNLKGLRETMNSVFSQTEFSNFEYIVVDGGSCDGSRELIESQADKISIWVSEADNGIYNAMNKGVSMSSGDYLLFLNSGDVLHSPDVIGAFLPLLERTDFVIGRIKYMNTGELSNMSETLTLKYFFNGSLPHPATFVRHELLVGTPYDESCEIVSDWKFFLQTIVLENASYRYEDVIVTDYDCNGISSRNRDLCKNDREKVLREMFPDRVLLDYEHFLKGEGYQDTDYDRLFVKIRDYKYGRVFYSAIVVFLRFVSIFKRSAKYSRDFPIFLKK